MEAKFKEFIENYFTLSVKTMVSDMTNVPSSYLNIPQEKIDIFVNELNLAMLAEKYMRETLTELEYGVFYGKFIIEQVRERFSFDELKKSSTDEGRIRARVVVEYAKKIATSIVNTMNAKHCFNTLPREYFGVFPDCELNYNSVFTEFRAESISALIVNGIYEEYIQWLRAREYIPDLPSGFVSIVKLLEYDDLSDKELWDELYVEDDND